MRASHVLRMQFGLWSSVLFGFVLCTAQVRGEHAEGRTAESTEFVVCSYPGGPSAASVLREAEWLRKQLCETWLGGTRATVWRPRCEVVIHGSRASYLQVVGRAGAQTFGSSLIQTSGNCITRRRIDLLLDPQGRLSALAHELTHVVLADHFAGRQAPRWLDEGIALLSDSPRKQSLHQRDCRNALANGTAYRLIELLTLDQFASPHQIASFYGQSHSLVQFLAHLDHPTRLLAFAHTASEHGYDRALREHYGISSVAELERQWRAHAAKPDGRPVPSLLVSTAR